MIALLVFKPGLLRDGLNALLSSMQEVQVLAQASDADAALGFLAGHCADLALIKLEAGDRQLLGAILEMRALCPDLRVAAFIEDERDRSATEASGTDLVTMVGVPAAGLKADLRAMMQSEAAIA